VDTTNSQQTSQSGSQRNRRSTLGEDQPSSRHAHRMEEDDCDRYSDHSIDIVERVRRAKEAAQRKMEEFGDPSEYDVFVLRDGKWVPANEAQSASAKTQEPATPATPQNSATAPAPTNLDKSSGGQP
jgi:hypothetical protein